ncbi:hypothetical protein HRI_002040600 [Hibiscus trionum]|uniref:Uncharacterized protein n=1 Tax=Hibiscus trionum TaxID=183268 RepID=A0A9W7HUJ4_HIBTR|nr:hypothetical protein HRI_002040600 [Hibiscus trionum]
MEFDGEVVKFDVYKAMRYPGNVASLNFVDIIEPVVEEFFESNFINDMCRENGDFEYDTMEFEKKFSINNELSLTPSKSKLLPSILKAPKFELKQLPDHLKYAFFLEKKELSW